MVLSRKGKELTWSKERECPVCKRTFTIDDSCSHRIYCSENCFKYNRKIQKKENAKTPDQLEKARIRSKEFREKNGKEYNAFQRKRRLYWLNRFFEYKGGKKCLSCGVNNWHPFGYAFHHCKGKKVREISRYITDLAKSRGNNPKGLREALEELAKCALLCVYCHILITHKVKKLTRTQLNSA